MSTFAPTSILLDPPDRPDHLAGAVLASLGRGVAKKEPWGPIKSAILGALTFGLLPLWIWPRKFRDVAIREQQVYWHLAEWLRLRTGRPEAVTLRDSTEILSVPKAGVLIPLVLAIAVFGLFCHILATPAITYSQLLFATYRLDRENFYSIPMGLTFHQAWAFWQGWTGALCIAYLVHWVQVHHHAATVDQFSRSFNTLLEKEGIEPIEVRRPGNGLRLMWIIVALVGTSRGAVWAIPMALAGSAQAYYVNKETVALRKDLVNRVRFILLRHRPAVSVPLPLKMTAPPDLQRICINDMCRAPLKGVASFCPRCGARAWHGLPAHA